VGFGFIQFWLCPIRGFSYGGGLPEAQSPSITDGPPVPTRQRDFWEHPLGRGSSCSASQVPLCPSWPPPGGTLGKGLRPDELFSMAPKKAVRNRCKKPFFTDSFTFPSFAFVFGRRPALPIFFLSHGFSLFPVRRLQNQSSHTEGSFCPKMGTASVFF